MEAWHLDQSLQQIKELLLDFDDFKVSHSFQEANRVADLLANLGANAALAPQNEIFEEFRHLGFE